MKYYFRRNASNTSTSLIEGERAKWAMSQFFLVSDVGAVYPVDMRRCSRDEDVWTLNWDCTNTVVVMVGALCIGPDSATWYQEFSASCHMVNGDTLQVKYTRHYS